MICDYNYGLIHPIALYSVQQMRLWRKKSSVQRLRSLHDTRVQPSSRNGGTLVGPKPPRTENHLLETAAVEEHAALAAPGNMDARRRKTARRALSQTAPQHPPSRRRSDASASAASSAPATSGSGGQFNARPFVAMPADVDSAAIPDWVPEVSSGARADVYPVSAARPPFLELELDRSAVMSGYFERGQAYEFASALSDADGLRSTSVPLSAPAGAPPVPNDVDARLAKMVAKIAKGVSELRRARPSRAQRELIETVAPPDASAGATKRAPGFPFQKPGAGCSLEEWLSRLAAGGAHTTASLAARVPLGPAIVRSTGKVLELMALKGVPTQRAAWYIRVSVLNECVKQVRPDRPPPSPALFWTRQLCNLMKGELDAIRARKHASLGTMDRYVFWQYVLDLARWQADEGLLDMGAWLDRVAGSARTELLSSPALQSNGAKIAVLALQRFLPEFCADQARMQAVRDALVPVSGYLLALHVSQISASSAPRRTQGRQPMAPLLSTTSPAAFNKAAYGLALYLGNAGVAGETIARLEMHPPEKMTDRDVIEAALEIVSEGVGDTVAEKGDKADLAGYTSESPSKGKGKKMPVWDGPPRVVLPTDATAALEEFPAVGNPVVLCKVLRKAFAKRGGDRAAVEHVCRWATATAASSLGASQVVATAAVAIDLLSDSASSPVALTSASSKNEGVQEALVKKTSLQSTETSVSSSRPPPAAVRPLPCYHREIWLFLKDLAEDDEQEADALDDRVTWMLSRMCRIGVFSLSSFVRDVARLSSLAHPSSARLVRYVQQLPEPEDRPSADSRRALLRRNGLLPSRAEEKRVSDLANNVMVLLLSGDEMASIKAGAKLKQEEGGNVRVILSVVDSVVSKVSETPVEKAEQMSVLLRPTVSFLRAIGVSALAADFLLDRLSRILAVVSDKARVQSLGNSVFVPVVAGLECICKLGPVFAATNRLAAALGILGRLWTAAGSGAAQQRLRVLVERAALVFGKYFCGRPTSDHARWKDFVVSSLQGTNFATAKQLYVALLSGQLQTQVGQGESLQKPQMTNLLALLSSSSQCVMHDIGKYAWHTSCLDQLNVEKKVNLRTAVVGAIDPNAFDRFYTELGSVNQVAEGVIIPVLGVSAKLKSAYLTAIGNITSILGSVWMEALGDELRPVFAIRIVALIVVGALYAYPGAATGLEKLLSWPWLRRLISLHGGKAFFDELQHVVMESVPSDAGISIENIADLLVSSVAELCGKAHEDEAAIIRGFGLEPLGATQIQLCSQHAVRAARGAEEDFGTEACEALITMASKDECATVARMILECHASGSSKVTAAGHIGMRALEQMGDSLNYFVSGVTAEHPPNFELNQERSLDWFRVDEARCETLHAVAATCNEEQSGQLMDALREHFVQICTQLDEAAGKRCMPRDVSPDGVALASAIGARVRTLLVLARKRPSTVHWEGLACTAARLLKSAVPVLSPAGVDDLVALLRLCVGQASALGANAEPAGLAEDGHAPLLAELRALLAGVHAWLEPGHARALRKACGEPPRGARPRPAVVARDADGGRVDPWYLLEGYGFAEGETPAIPLAAIAGQGEGDAERRPSVRLKRTFSTFSCLVR